MTGSRPLQEAIDEVLTKDIDDVITWGQQVAPTNSESAYRVLALAIFRPDVSPITKVKGLALLQSILHAHPALKRSDLSGYVVQ